MSIDAREVVERLNSLLKENDALRRLVAALIEQRVPADGFEHPNVTTYLQGGKEWFGLLGVLNGLVETKDLIAAYYTESDGEPTSFKGFVLLDSNNKSPTI